jgi:hypothetical protein
VRDAVATHPAESFDGLHVSLHSSSRCDRRRSATAARAIPEQDTRTSTHPKRDRAAVIYITLRRINGGRGDERIVGNESNLRDE